MNKIKLEEIDFGDCFVSFEIKYEEFIQKFGEKHYEHPDDWDAPGPVELWCFELPWGHKIVLEYHLAISNVNLIMGRFEVNSTLEYLGVENCNPWVSKEYMVRLQEKYPKYTDGIGQYALYRQDDNGNQVLMKTYESRRIADYYRKFYEERKHKQLYWVEDENS